MRSQPLPLEYYHRTILKPKSYKSTILFLKYLRTKRRSPARMENLLKVNIPLQSCVSKMTQPEANTVPETEEGTCERVDPYGLPLNPTPTNDPLDPLNFNRSSKICCLIVVCMYSFLLIYSTTVYIPTTALLQSQFGATYGQITWTIAMPSLGLGISPLLTKPFADLYGRRIVCIVNLIIVIIMSGCLAIPSITLSGYMTCRFFQGIGAGPGSNIGLSILDDISWSHERGFRIGLWVMATTLGAPCGIISECQIILYI